MKRLTILTSVALCMAAQTSLAQDVLLDGADQTYVQSSTTSQLSHYNNSTYFVTKAGVENLLQGKLCKSKEVGLLAVNPKGESYAVVKSGSKVKSVQVYNLWKANKKVGEVKVKDAVKACCYSADGQELLVADDKGTLTRFSTQKYKKTATQALPLVPEKMTVSPNGKVLAILNDKTLQFIDLATGETVGHLVFPEAVSAFEYTTNSKYIMVLKKDGGLYKINMRTYAFDKYVDSLGDAIDLGVHPEGKYVSVITADSRIAIVNLVDESERFYVNVAEGGASEVFYTTDTKGIIYMVYNTASSIHYKQMSELSPYLGGQIEDEVSLMMEEWEKRMPEETDEAYALRMSEENRERQMRMFEDEVATRMAGDYANSSTIQFSKYNPETNMMELDFDNMSPIYLTVDNEDINSFTSPDDIELRNPIYTVGPDDTYQLVYADVYNKKTGKTYTFDNREHKSLDYLASDEGFMPLQYAQQNNDDAMELDEIKNEVVTGAMQTNDISEHTDITVSTEMLRNADQTIDYKVSFTYAVDDNFSAKEDFAAGVYNNDRSKAAQTMLNIVKQAMSKRFSRYIQQGKKVLVKIKGSADAKPIRKALTYKGEYGDFVDAPVIKDNEATTITVTQETGITTNDQLAYLRAQGMKQSITKNVSDLKKMDTEYEISIEQAEGVGGKFRRVYVDFIFIDAFK